MWAGFAESAEGLWCGIKNLLTQWYETQHYRKERESIVTTTGGGEGGGGGGRPLRLAQVEISFLFYFCP